MNLTIGILDLSYEKDFKYSKFIELSMVNIHMIVWVILM